jgi:hypothetical protein
MSLSAHAFVPLDGEALGVYEFCSGFRRASRYANAQTF